MTRSFVNKWWRKGDIRHSQEMTRSFVNKWWRKGDIRHSQVYSSRALTSSPGGTQEPDVVSEQHE
jgi:hypothetical protein